jgi:hypothetical protein
LSKFLLAYIISTGASLWHSLICFQCTLVTFIPPPFSSSPCL